MLYANANFTLHDEMIKTDIKIKEIMYYIRESNKCIDFDDLPIFDLYIELDNDGNSIREIGFDYSGNLVHKFPSVIFRYGTYGLFNLVSYSTRDLESDISKEKFEKIWNNGICRS